MADHRPAPWQVWGRSGALAAVVYLVGLGSHVLAGGNPPGVAAGAVLYLLAVAAVSPLLLVRLSRPAVVAAVVAGQALVHLALSSLAGHADVVATGSWWHHQWAHLSAQGPDMLLAHSFAAGVVGLWLAEGEQWLSERVIVLAARAAAATVAVAVQAWRVALVGAIARGSRTPIVTASPVRIESDRCVCLGARAPPRLAW